MMTDLTTIDLPGSTEAVGEARRRVRQVLRTSNLRMSEDALHDIGVCVSELFTNAIKHTASGHGGRVIVIVSTYHRVVRITVIDDGAAATKPYVPDYPGAENGRGLRLVDALADRWGTQPEDIGSEVWIEFDPQTYDDSMREGLPIADELLLLALREEDGRRLIGLVELNHALSAALLADLALAGRIVLSDDRLTVADANAMGDADLDEALGRLATERKRRRPDWWIRRIQDGPLHDRRLSGLVELGILQVTEQRWMGIPISQRHPANHPLPRIQIETRLRTALDGAGDDRSIALLGLASGCGLIPKVFPGRPGNELRQCVTELTRTAMTTESMARTISAIAQAIPTAIRRCD